MLCNTELSIKQLKNDVSKVKFNIPPSKISVLSSETLAVLDNLNIKNSLKAQLKSSDEILNSVSPREKFQDLLDPVVKLSLPYKYKRLLQLQELLDSTLNNARIRGLPRYFYNLKQAIETTYSCSLDLEHIQKLLLVCPGLYKLTWLVDDGEEKLEIDLPEESSYSLSVLHNRTAVLKDELLKRVKHYHKIHLDSIGVSFNADLCKTWHSSFQLHEVPDLPLAELPEKTENKDKKASIGNQLRRLRLYSLCKTLVTVFSNHKIPSLFMKSLIKKIIEIKEQDQDQKLIAADLTEISEIFPSWLSIIKTESGQVARLNKQLDFSLKEANKKLKEKYGLIQYIKVVNS